MEFKHLQTFRHAAESGSFTRAAERLGYVQSNVTAHIQVLEGELGVPLFDRLGRQVRLTAAGRRLLDYAVRLLALADEARIAVSEGGDELTLAAPETICTYALPALLRAAREQLPQLRLAFRPLRGCNLRQHVAVGEVDVAFTLEAPYPSSGLHVVSLRREPVLLLAPPDHSLTAHAAVSPTEVVTEPLLLTEAGCPYRVQFEQSLATVGGAQQAVLEFGSVEAIKQCVIAGMGLAVLPAVVAARELAAGTLVTLPWVGPSLDVTTQLVYHAERWYGPAARAFIELAQESLAEAVQTEEAMR